MEIRSGRHLYSNTTFSEVFVYPKLHIKSDEEQNKIYIVL